MSMIRALRSMTAVLSLVPILGAPSATAADWVTTSLPQGSNYALAVAPDGDVYAYGGGSLHRSSDEGLTWTSIGPLAQNSFPHTLAVSPSGALYAADFAVGVFRSDDDGATWSASLVDEGCNGFAIDPQGVLFGGLTYTGNGRVHRSGDGGANWQSIGLPGATPSFSTECFAFGGPGEVFAGAIDGFYRSSDHGLTWQASSSGLVGRHVRTMAAAANGHLFVHTLFPAQIDGLYRSIDGGDSWQRRAGNAPYFSALIAAPDGSLIGTSDEHVVRSVDEGLVWTDIAAGIPANENLESIVVTPSGHLLAGGYRVHRNASSVLDAPSTPDRALALRQNHPNPVRGTTRIGFTLARSAHVELAVFDLSGRCVATLARGVRAAGEHAETFDASRLPAGVYGYRLVADGIANARRLLVIR